MEVDTAFFTDPDGAKADDVDVNLGEFSEFHNEFGYYPQGVSVSTGVFPAGWRDRLVVFETLGTEPGRGLCLEPHDCILAKLVPLRRERPRLRGRPRQSRDSSDLDTLAERAGTLPAHPAVIDRIQTWINAMRTR